MNESRLLELGLFLATLGWALRYVHTWPVRLSDALPVARRLIGFGLVVLLLSLSPTSLRGESSWAACSGFLALAIASWGLRRVEPTPGAPLLSAWPLVALTLSALAWLGGSWNPAQIALALWASGLCLGLARLYRAAGRDLLETLARVLAFALPLWVLLVCFGPRALLEPTLSGVDPLFARPARAASFVLRFGPLLASGLLLQRMKVAHLVVRQREADHEPDVPAQRRSSRAAQPDELAPVWVRPARFPRTSLPWLVVGALSLAGGVALNYRRRLDRFPAGYVAHGLLRDLRYAAKLQARESLGCAGVAGITEEADWQAYLSSQPAYDSLLVLKDPSGELLLCGRFRAEEPRGPLRWEPCASVAELSRITGVAPAELSRVDLGEYRQFRWGLDTFGVERVRAWGSGSVGSWSYVHCAGFVALRHGDARGVGVVRIRATGEGRAAEVEVYPDPKAARQGLLGGYRPFDIDMLLTW